MLWSSPPDLALPPPQDNITLLGGLQHLSIQGCCTFQEHRDGHSYGTLSPDFTSMARRGVLSETECKDLAGNSIHEAVMGHLIAFVMAATRRHTDIFDSDDEANVAGGDDGNAGTEVKSPRDTQDIDHLSDSTLRMEGASESDDGAEVSRGWVYVGQRRLAAVRVACE